MKPRAFIENPSIGTQYIDSQLPGKSSGQQVIIPYTKKTEQTTTICLNSRERNVISYPNPNSFRWRLRNDIKDITSIRLIGGTIPSNLYNINIGWNKFILNENNINYTVTLNPGKYNSGNTIAVELQRALNAVSVNKYTVSYSSISLLLNITRTTGLLPFLFLFKSGIYNDKFDDFFAVESLSNDYLSGIGCPARLLGFVSYDYQDNSGTITSQFPIDLAWFLNKVFIHINTGTSKELNRIKTSQSSHDPYTIITLDNYIDGIKHLNKETDYPILEFSTPLSRLSLLEISLRDEYFKLLDIQNKEFILIFEITHLL